MKKTKVISALLAALCALSCFPFTASADGDASTMESVELLSGLSGGAAGGVGTNNALLKSGEANSYLRVDNQPMGNCILTLKLTTDELSKDEKYVLAFKVRAQVDDESFRGVRYTVGDITRNPVGSVNDEWLSHISKEFTVSAGGTTLSVNFQGDANYFSVNPYDIDELGVYKAKKDSDGSYILDDTTAVFFNDFEGEGDTYSMSNTGAGYTTVETETSYIRLDGSTETALLSVGDGGIALEPGTYLLKGDARMSYFFNGALNVTTPDTRHTYTAADGRGVVHDGSCEECAKFTNTVGDVKNKNDAKYKLSRHLVFGNPSDLEKYRDTSLYNDGVSSYHHIIYTWTNSSAVFKHSNYRSLTAAAVGKNASGADVSIDAVFIRNTGTSDDKLDVTYKPMAANGSSIDITDDWSAFAAVITVDEAMTLESLSFGGVDGALDFDDFDIRALSLKKGDPEQIVGSQTAVMVDKEDITEERYMETHFNFNDGGWNTNPTYDTVSDGVLVITANTPTRNVTHDVTPGYKYEIEFRLKIDRYGGECGFKYEFNDQRIFMQFGNGFTRVPVYGGANKSIKLDSVGAYHTYKMVVEGSICDLYVDGDYQFTYTLPSHTNPAHNDKLSFFVNSSTVTVDYVIFRTTPAAITLVPPTTKIKYSVGSKATMKAVCDGDAAGAPYVDYYANGTYIGTAYAENGYALEWSDLREGTYYLQAKYGEFSSDMGELTVRSANTYTAVTADKTALSVGETVTFGLAKNVKTAKSVVYYVNGAAIVGNTYTPSMVGRTAVSAKIDYNDGSFAYADGIFLDVTASAAEGVVLQSSYIAEYTASEGARITASDGMYALDITHTAAGVACQTSDGTETYSLGLGDYRVQVDGGVCDVYYNGQFAFSYRMPVADAANGIATVGVSGLKLSGINASVATVTDDGAAYYLPDISQKYAVEFIIDGKKDFGIVVSDGAWETNITASNGTALVNTYPNLDNGVVETAEAFTLDDGRHVCRVIAANGIAQIFIDNAWAYSFRMPQEFTVSYASAYGTGRVQIRETNDLYVFSDSFDGKGELDSSVYWDTDDDLNAEFKNGAMILKPNEAAAPTNQNVFSVDFDSEDTPFSGTGYSIKDGIMTVSNSDTEKSHNILASIESSKDFVLEVRARVTGFGVETGMKLEYPTNRVMVYFYKDYIAVKGTESDLKIDINATEWHTYRFVVTDTSKCEVFIDGESRGTLNLMARTFSSSVIGFFSKPKAGGTTCIEVDSVIYTRNDAVPTDSSRNLSTATIKAVCLDSTVSASVKVGSTDKGSIYLAARYDSEYRNLLAGYNFEKGAWEIVKTKGQGEVLASAVSAFPFGEEVTLDFKVSGTSAVLCVNGEEVLTASTEADHYGAVGISVGGGITAEILDYSYEGTSRPIAGALSFVNNARTPEVFETTEGHIFVTTGGGGGYESVDDGITWENVQFGKYSENTIVLSSGTIVYTKRENVGTGENYVDYAYVSTDGGETFEGPYAIQSYVRNRITMNNKLTESSTGRLFFASGESGHGVEGEGGERVFYSDDEGRTWVGANLIALDGETVISGDDEARLDIDNCGVNFQESKVVEMPDGTFRLYHRTDEGFRYYSVSTDNGETWTTQMWTSEFPATLCAFNIERDPYTGYYYMAWEYNAANDYAIAQRPRNRVGLAVSYDGMETWEYIGDIHINKNAADANAHFNIGLKPTANAVYVDVVHATHIGSADGTEAQVNYMVRIDKASIKSTKRFTSLITLAETEPQPTEEQAIDSAITVSADGSAVFADGKTYTVENPVAGYIPASIMADYVGAAYTANGSTASFTLCSVNGSFTVGSTAAVLGGKTVTMTAAPIMGADGIMLPITALRDVFSRELTTASNGSYVSLNKLLTRGTSITSETMSAYLPVSVHSMSASEIDRPDSWAVPEVDAANAEKIVPSALNSEYRLAITREEFCELIMTMLVKKYGAGSAKALVEKLGYKYENIFTDTDKASIVAANCIGIVNGRGAGIFDPDSGITRQEAAVMLANAAKVLNINGGDAVTFIDMAGAASWAVGAISTVTSIVSTTGARVMGGVGSGMFDPLGTYNRQQAILTVYRLFMSK